MKKQQPPKLKAYEIASSGMPVPMWFLFTPNVIRLWKICSFRLCPLQIQWKCFYIDTRLVEVCLLAVYTHLNMWLLKVFVWISVFVLRSHLINFPARQVPPLYGMLFAEIDSSKNVFPMNECWQMVLPNQSAKYCLYITDDGLEIISGSWVPVSFRFK